jgi:hypothetical protein
MYHIWWLLVKDTILKSWIPFCHFIFQYPWPLIRTKNLHTNGSSYVWYKDSRWKGEYFVAWKPFCYFIIQFAWPLTFRPMQRLIGSSSFHGQFKTLAKIYCRGWNLICYFWVFHYPLQVTLTFWHQNLSPINSPYVWYGDYIWKILTLKNQEAIEFIQITGDYIAQVRIFYI